MGGVEVLSVGQRIVCVNDHIDGADTFYRTQTLPVHGRIYTVRAVIPCRAHGFTEDGLHLVEVVNRPQRWRSPTGLRTIELAFRVSRFRPVRGTNIESVPADVGADDASA